MILYVCIISVIPGEPSVETNKSRSDLQEGDTVQFDCSSTGGNPPPIITWYRNNVPIESTTTPPSDKFGTTHGYIVRELGYDDDGAVMKCQVESEAGNGLLQEVTLGVKCECWNYILVKTSFYIPPLIVVHTFHCSSVFSTCTDYCNHMF